jgi:hypothetical protein
MAGQDLGSLPIEWGHSKWEADQTYNASSEAHGPQPEVFPLAESALG